MRTGDHAMLKIVTNVHKLNDSCTDCDTNCGLFSNILMIDVYFLYMYFFIFAYDCVKHVFIGDPSYQLLLWAWFSCHSFLHHPQKKKFAGAFSRTLVRNGCYGQSLTLNAQSFHSSLTSKSQPNKIRGILKKNFFKVIFRWSCTCR